MAAPEGNRRTGKATSSVVVFMDQEIPMVISEEGTSTELRGRSIPVGRDNCGRRRKRATTEDQSGW